MYNFEHSTVMVADVLRRCDEKFAASAEKSEILHFDMTTRDLQVLAVLYPKIKTANVQVRTFLNSVIQRQLKMPFELTTMLADSHGRRFTCRAKRANLVLD